ncbi:MAG: RNA polymerase sigma factor [Spirochaetes bacterium]|nr:RNA polymerase sigma factor [Spirochaetota bacterium]
MMKSSELITITLNAMLSKNREVLFRHVWEHYRKRLYYYVTAVMHCSPEDGEDLVQEIMMKVYDTIGRYKTGRSFNAWIYTITRNHCIDFMRKKDARPCGEELRDTADRVYDPLEDVCAGELNHAIRTSLDRLDDVDREMMYLRHFEGLRYASIGALVGMNVNSVKTRMRAIEARLRHELKEWL